MPNTLTRTGLLPHQLITVTKGLMPARLALESVVGHSSLDIDDRLPEAPCPIQATQLPVISQASQQPPILLNPSLAVPLHGMPCTTPSLAHSSRLL